MKNDCFLLKIQILDSKPSIWRRLYVPSNISLDRLHDVFQVVMGWNDEHIYDFVFNGKPYTILPENEPDGESVEAYRLKELVNKKGATFDYVYDFGDNWVHQVVVEDINYKPAGPEVLIECLDGDMACPPENVGGIHQYEDFCAAMTDSSHEMYEDYQNWYFGVLGKNDFDPAAFDLDAVNRELEKYLRWSRDRVLGWEEV